MRRFIIAAEPLSAQQERAFLDYLGDNNINWWHRITNVWLLIDSEDGLTCEELKLKIKEISPAASVFVQELEEVDWSAAGSNDTFHKWLHSTWSDFSKHQGRLT